MWEMPELKKYNQVAIDLETYDPHLTDYGIGVRHEGYICGIAIAVETGEGWYIPFRHEEGFNFEELQVKRWALDNLLTDTPKIGANLLYDMDYLYEWGVPVRGQWQDIQIAEPLLNENQFKFSLETLSQKYLKYGKNEKVLEEWKEKNLTKKDTVKSNIYRMPSEIIAKYAKVDALNALKIFNLQKPLLEKEGLMDIFNLESDLLKMTLSMRQKGVRIDFEKTEQLKNQFLQEINKKQVQLNTIAGFEVNVNASRSIQKYCDMHNITYNLTPKSEEAQINKAFIEAHEHIPFFALLKALKEQKKLTDTFLTSILKHQNKGRIHCQFNQLKSDDFGTVSGRFSSCFPNLQQVPARTEQGKLIRTLFLPDHEEDWYKIDYSQIEPRITMHYGSGIDAKKARNIFIEDPTTDAYQPMINALPGIPRAMIKQIFLGLCYGMGKYKLCEQLQVTDEKGTKIINQFKKVVPFLTNLNCLAQNKAKYRGYIKTIGGRKRRFPNKNYCYKALNALIQGSSADILKKAMLKIWESGIIEEVGVPLLTVHDELDFSIPPNKKDIVKDIENIMLTTTQLNLPLHLDTESGRSWGEVQ